MCIISGDNSKHIPDIHLIFSPEILKDMIPDLYNLLDKYEYFIDLLLTVTPSIEPLLLLHVDDDEIYLGEEIHASEYFMAEGSFVENQIIVIYLDDVKIDSVLTDSRGRDDTIFRIIIWKGFMCDFVALF